MATRRLPSDIRNWLINNGNVSRQSKARVFGIGVVFLGWLILASLFPYDLMPYPWETLELVWELFSQGTVWTPLIASASRVIAGFVLAMLAGGLIGIFAGLNDYGRMFFVPYMVGGFTVPGIAWAAIFTLMFGIGFSAPVMAAAVTTYPYIAVNVWSAVQDIDADLLEMGNAFSLSRLRLIKNVAIPTIAPSLFNAVRYGVAISWKVVTSAEMFASTEGIGARLLQTFQQYRFDEVWAWAAFFMLLMIVIEYLIMRPLQRKVYAWRPDTDLSLLD